MILLLFIISCSQNKETVNNDLFSLGNKNVVLEQKNSLKSVSEISLYNKMETLYKNVCDERGCINTGLDYLELFLSNANCAVFKIVNKTLWVYLDESRTFFDKGWFYLKSNNFVKAVPYFEKDRIKELEPKYNQNTFYMFMRDNYNYITLYKFNKPIHTWTNESFYDNLKDTDILCIETDESAKQIWFGTKSTIKKYDIKSDIWSEPYKERTFSDTFNTMNLQNIVADSEIVWFFTFNGGIIVYNKKRDIWDPYENISNNYLSLINFGKKNVWFKSSNEIWRFNRISNNWTKFDLANFLDSKLIKNILFLTKKKILIETSDAFNIYDFEKNLWEIHRKSNFQITNYEGKKYIDNINDLLFDGNYLWLTSETGIINFNLKTKKWFIYDLLEINKKYNVNCTYFSKIYLFDNYIWISSDNGLFRIKRY